MSSGYDVVLDGYGMACGATSEPGSNEKANTILEGARKNFL
jgi:hypothetical protein